MSGNLKIPYGVCDFKRIRREGYYYIDKTGYIPLLERAGSFLFFVRPRRFGKSLMASLLRCYYDIAEKNNFDALNGRVREIAEEFAAAIDDGVPLDFELQLQMLHAFSGATLDAYAGFDEVLPEDWRERGEGYNMMFGISPDSMSPLFDAIYRSGVTPGGPGGFGPIPPPPQRQQ